jgi:hypothetical protein
MKFGGEYAYICGITPAAVIMMAVLLSFATVTAAVVDERFWGDNCHFDLWE